MKTLIILLIQLIVFSAFNPKADCPLADYYHLATITLRNNSIVEGYIILNHDLKIFLNWDENQCKNENCDEVIFYNSLTNIKEGNIYVYKKLNNLHKNFPFKGHAITPSFIDTINITRILKIEIGYNNPSFYAGSVFIIADKLLDLVISKPYDYYKLPTDENFIDTYLISYNKQINQENLIEISNTDFYKDKEELEKQKIIIVEYQNCSY